MVESKRYGFIQKGKKPVLSLDIFLLIGLVIFVGFRLYTVLGSRPEDEEQRKKPNPFNLQVEETADPTPHNAPTENEAPQRKKQASSPVGFPDYTAAMKTPAAQKVQKKFNEILEKENESFDGTSFLQGACRAFVAISDAFAEGRTEFLERYLSEKMLRQFSLSIEQREMLGQTLDLHISKILSSEIIEGHITKGILSITVRFTSNQWSDLKNKSGQSIIEDDTRDAYETLVDIWTFEKKIGGSDAWILVETRIE